MPRKVAAKSAALTKRAVIDAILAELQRTVANYERSAKAAHAEATDPQNKAENKYDTRGLEASYIARGQSLQAAELLQAVQEYQMMTPREFVAGAKADVGALVELERDGAPEWYFIGPAAGGTEVTVAGQAITVITAGSPLGRELVGKGEAAAWRMGSGPRAVAYKLLSVR